MAKGENIFKRKDGRWEARYIKDRDNNGKIQYGYCYGKTYREAKEKVITRKMSFLSTKKQVSSKEKAVVVLKQNRRNSRKSQDSDLADLLQ